MKAEQIGVRRMLPGLLTTEKTRASGSEDYPLEFTRGGTLASHLTSARVTCIRWGGNTHNIYDTFPQSTAKLGRPQHVCFLSWSGVGLSRVVSFPEGYRLVTDTVVKVSHFHFRHERNLMIIFFFKVSLNDSAVGWVFQGVATSS